MNFIVYLKLLLYYINWKRLDVKRVYRDLVATCPFTIIMISTWLEQRITNLMKARV